MKKMLTLALAVLTLLVIVVISACTNGGKQEETSSDNINTSENVTTTEHDSDVPTSSGEESSTEPETEEETLDPNSYVEVKLDLGKRIEKYFPAKTNTKVEFVEDESEGTVVKLSLEKNQPSEDYANVYLNMSTVCSAKKQSKISSDEYRCVIFKVKAENYKHSILDVYYCAGKISDPTVWHDMTAIIDNTSDEWQYVYYDLTIADYHGNVNGYRLDWLQGLPDDDNSSLYISSVIFVKDYETTLKYLKLEDNKTSPEPLSPEDQAKVDELLNSTIGSTSYDNYKPEKAANEDSKLNLWFNHTYTKTPAKVVTPGEMKTYRMMLAKNEIEACQFILSSEDAYSGLLAEITDFKNAAGQTLRTELFSGYYFEIEGEDVIDPLVPYPNTEGGDDGRFAIEAGTSKSFVIKVYTLENSASGEYTATLTVKDANGKEIKKATVFVYVWNFALPEQTSCKTLMDLSWYNIYVYHKCYEGDDSLLYTKYYDYLLENRVCSYDIPYIDKESGNPYSDERINKYLDNPRVVAFQPTGWAKSLTAERLQNAYKHLSQKQEWLDKAYFYPVDEPSSIDDLNRVVNAANDIKEYYSDNYKMIIPMHYNYSLDSANTVDFFEYLKDAVTVKCPKPLFFTTFEEYRQNRRLTWYMTSKLEKNLGLFTERMNAAKKDGNEVWWYVCNGPYDPEITLNTAANAVDYRVLFWQQKLYDVDGFLYYLTNNWYQGYDENGKSDLGWNPKHECASPYYNIYGDGVLVYCGAAVGIYGPVGSLRLECVRDGIEDFEYLTILENKLGKETTDLIINQLTTSVGRFSTDAEYFTALREKLGCLVESLMNE